MIFFSFAAFVFWLLCSHVVSCFGWCVQFLLSVSPLYLGFVFFAVTCFASVSWRFADFGQCFCRAQGWSCAVLLFAVR